VSAIGGEVKKNRIWDWLFYGTVGVLAMSTLGSVMAIIDAEGTTPRLRITEQSDNNNNSEPEISATHMKIKLPMYDASARCHKYAASRRKHTNCFLYFTALNRGEKWPPPVCADRNKNRQLQEWCDAKY
jgi:hypothetical protein